MDEGYEEEEWAYIPDFSNYMISNFGRVWSNNRNRMLRPGISRGYMSVSLCRNGTVSQFKVHRLVAAAFLPDRPEAIQVNHDNGDKGYNHVSNLEWATPSENILHAFRTGLSSRNNKRPVRIIETGEEFESMSACAKKVGMDTGHLHARLQDNRRTRRGFTFEYIN